MVDNGEVITGSAPGQLRQLNTQAGLYLGGSLLYLNKKVAVSADFSDSEYNIFFFCFQNPLDVRSELFNRMEVALQTEGTFTHI